MNILNWIKGLFAPVIAFLSGFFTGKLHEKYTDAKAEVKEKNRQLDIAAEPPKRGSSLLDSLSDD